MNLTGGQAYQALVEPLLLRDVPPVKPLIRFAYRRLIVIYRVVAVAFAGSLLVSASFAEPAAPSSEKSETSCTTSTAAMSGSGDEKTSNSVAVEKSAILPDAGGANSAAPTVQSGGKPMEIRPDCPPDSKPK
jgi:hypothetical protein